MPGCGMPFTWTVMGMPEMTVAVARDFLTWPDPPRPSPGFPPLLPDAPNWREGAALDIAAAALGLVVNPIVPIYRDAELRFILKDARSRAIFIPDQYRSIDFINMVQALRPDLPELEHVVLLRAEQDYEGTLHYRALVECAPLDESELCDVDPNSVDTVFATEDLDESTKRGYGTL